MKSIFRYKISFPIAAFLLVFVLSTGGFAQAERISADASQSVSADDTPRPREAPRGRTRTTAEQFQQIRAIPSATNKLNILSARGSEPYGVTLCREYQENFEPQFNDRKFANKHIKLSADEFALAFILFENDEVNPKFPSALALAFERAEIEAGRTERTYEKILTDKVFNGDKSRAKQALKAAREELKTYKR